MFRVENTNLTSGHLQIDIADVRLKSFVILAGGGEGRPGWETVPCSCLSLRSFVKRRLRTLLTKEMGEIAVKKI
ncbi:hypothetical protein DPMN_104384, partial [Dreissena polymorpha]